MILRAIRPIKKDEIVYDNYGPIYSMQSFSERQQKLKNRYWFDCQCKACTENFPMYRDLDTDEIKLLCVRCGKGFWITTKTTMPNIKCPSNCGQINSIVMQLCHLHVSNT